jgi:putative ATPase
VKSLFKDEPLAFRMSPRTLEEYIGQEHIIGKDKLLRRAIEADRISSIILYGPPGTGKTALARVIANHTESHFDWLNAATVGLPELRKVIAEARKNKKAGEKTILFLDEIHRFNKLQQDALLPDVEEGNVVLIAATVENPFFYVNSALLSRSQVFELKSLSKEELLKIMKAALLDKERGLGGMNIEADEEALNHLAKTADGDARRALSALELAALTTSPDANGIIRITKEIAEESIQKKAVLYDKTGDQHYDTISAFIKSMRGSDPDAAIYYLAKMLYAGEDPRFIVRRLVIFCAEDIGNKDPMALVLAVSALRAVEFLGMPEARIPLSQAVIYASTAPKSNKAIVAIDRAMKDVEEETTLQVPDHLKDTHYRGAEKLGHGKGYKYPHDYPDSKVAQEYLKEKKKYYEPD